MDCDEIQRRLETGASVGEPAAAAHLASCDACAAMVAASAVLARPRAPNEAGASFLATMDAIDRDAHSIAKLRSWSTPRRQALGLAIAFAMPMIVLAVTPRPDLAAYPILRGLIEVIGLAAAAVSAAMIALRPMHRPASVMSSHWVALFGVLVVIALASVPAAHVDHAAAHSDDLVARALGCLAFGTLCAVPTWIGLRLLARDGDRLGTRAEVVAAASAGVGVAGVYLHCPVVDPGHLWLGHVTVLLLPWLWALWAQRQRG